MGPRAACTVAVSLAALLITATAAPAKEVDRAKVCGDSECVVLSGATANTMVEGGYESDPPAKAAPFFRVRFTVEIDQGRTESFGVTYVPQPRMIKAADGAWMTPEPRVRRAFDRAVEGLKPFPARRLTGLDAPGLPEAVVDEVVPAPDPEPASADGTSWALPAGGLALLALVAAALVFRARREPTGPARARPAPR